MILFLVICSILFNAPAFLGLWLAVSPAQIWIPMRSLAMGRHGLCKQCWSMLIFWLVLSFMFTFHSLRGMIIAVHSHFFIFFIAGLFCGKEGGSPDREQVGHWFRAYSLEEKPCDRVASVLFQCLKDLKDVTCCYLAWLPSKPVCATSSEGFSNALPNSPSMLHWISNVWLKGSGTKKPLQRLMQQRSSLPKLKIW